MTENRIVKEYLLDNGLKLRMFDESRPTTGGWWQVRLVARVEVQVEPVSFPRASDQPDIQEILGPTRTFEQKRDKNWVAEGEKDEAYQQLCDSFLQRERSYLSHPDFPKKFIKKEYMDEMKKRDPRA